MLFTHIAPSIHALKTNRIHSLLTIFGITIGVGASVLALNIIDGARQQIIKEVGWLNSGIIVVRSGDSVRRNQTDQTIQYDLTQNPGVATLTLGDLTTIDNLPVVERSAPVISLSFDVSSSRQRADNQQIIGTTSNFLDLTSWELDQGSMFSNGVVREAVLGFEIAVELFSGRSPIGQAVRLQEHDFVVRGVLENIPHGPVAFGPNYNQAVLIPMNTVPSITRQNLPIYEILAGVKGDPQQAIAAIDDQLLLTHQRQDFSVFEWTELVGATNRVFDSITIMVGVVVAIVLIISGTGIMNIMLANVTERTREIGIRKAVGASKADIMRQFLTEAIILSLLGGLIGILLAEVGSLAIGLLTNIQPTFMPDVIIGALLISVILGVVFGVGPAHRAAQKEPVEALRS